MVNNNTLPNWLYNEFQASGVDYTDLEVVQQFDNRHRQFRDFDKEFQVILERTGLLPDDIVLDLGCGSGAFVIPAAQYCRKVYGADVSKHMLTVLGQKLFERKLTNVELRNAGLLTFWALDDCPNQFDFIISSIALHHLPDFWKAVAIKQIADALKPGGIFYLYDVVFNFPVEEWRSGVQKLLDEMESAAGHEANAHISAEFSSFSWILEGIFERVGLKVEKKYDDTGFLRAYVCRKNPPLSPLVLSTPDVRRIDEEAIQRWRIPPIILMENAARSLADIFLGNASRLNHGVHPKRVLIVCGKGNNGGDGFALFRQLELSGIETSVATLQPLEEYSGIARINCDIVTAMTKDSPNKLFVVDDSPQGLDLLQKKVENADWIVDAMLGSGTKGELRAPYDKIVGLLNKSGKPIYAIDVPTGLNSNDGCINNVAIKATITVTLAALKPGLITDAVKEYVGELHVGNIGIPIQPLIS